MKHVSGGVAIVVLLLSLVGCTVTSSSEGSRAEVYGSLEELAADSAVVVVVTATGETETAKEPQLLTGTHVVVDESLTPKGLPADSPSVDVGDVATIWQIGDSTNAGPLPLLRDGERYLLFLVPTGLDKPSGYFITGSSAGFWIADGSNFVRPVDEGDRLPKALTLDELK